MTKAQKVLCFCAAILLVLALSACGVIQAASGSGLSDTAKQGIQIANASTIAGFINLFNSQQTSQDKMILTISSVQDLKVKLGKSWPDNLSDQDAEQAIKLIKIDSAAGVATVDTAITSGK